LVLYNLLNRTVSLPGSLFIGFLEGLTNCLINKTKAVMILLTSFNNVFNKTEKSCFKAKKSSSTLFFKCLVKPNIIRYFSIQTGKNYNPIIESFDNGKLLSYLQSVEGRNSDFALSLNQIGLDMDMLENLILSEKDLKKLQQKVEELQITLNEVDINVGYKHEDYIVSSDLLEKFDSLCQPKSDVFSLDPHNLFEPNPVDRIFRRNKTSLKEFYLKLNRLFLIFNKNNLNLSGYVIFGINNLVMKSVRNKKVEGYKKDLFEKIRKNFNKKAGLLEEVVAFEKREEFHETFDQATAFTTICSPIFHQYELLVLNDPDLIDATTENGFIYESKSNYNLSADDRFNLSLCLGQYLEYCEIIHYDTIKLRIFINGRIVRGLKTQRSVSCWPSFIPYPDHELGIKKLIGIPLSNSAQKLQIRTKKVFTNTVYSQRRLGQGNLNSFLGKQSSDSFASFSISDLEVLNRSQKIPFKIDKPFLSVVLEDSKTFFDKHLESFLENSSDSSGAFKEGYFMLDFEKFKHYHSSYIYRDVFNRLSLTSEQRIQVDKRCYELFEYHQAYKNLFIEFFMILILSDVLSKTDSIFFFSNKLDWRRRLYFEGNLLCPIGASLSRNLLTFVNKTPLPPISEEFYKKVFQKSLKAIENGNLNRLSSKDFNNIKYVLSRRNISDKANVLGTFDVTGSGSQIISGLIGFLPGLIATNLIKLTADSGEGEKQDIHLEYTRAARDHVKLIISKLRQKQKKLPAVETRVFRGKIQNIQNIFEEIRCEIDFWEKVLNTTTRSRSKSIVMKGLYGQKNKTRVEIWLKEIQEVLEPNAGVKYRGKFSSFTKKYPCLIFPEIFQAFSVITEGFSSKVYSQNVKNLIKSHNILLKDLKPKTGDFNFNEKFLRFKEQKRLCDQKLISEINTNFSNPFLIINIADYSTYISLKKVIKKCATITFKNGMNRRVAYQTTKNELDVVKMENSAVVHAVHSIDSTLIFETIKRYQKKRDSFDFDVRVYFSVHDSFRGRTGDLRFLEECYFESFKSFVLKGDFIDSYLRDNGVEVSKCQLETWRKGRENILAKLDSGELCISPFVLTE
jgi:hypothetical protein